MCSVTSVMSWLSAMPWTEVCQAPVSMGFSWQECQSGLPCPPPEDLPPESFSRGSPPPEDQPRGWIRVYPASAEGFLSAEPPRKHARAHTHTHTHTYLLGTLGCMYLFKLVGFFFFLMIYPGVELLGHMVVLFLVFLRKLHTFLQWLQQFTFPLTVCEGSPFFTSS